MRDATEQTRQLIADGGFEARFVADLVYDGERRISGIDLERGSTRLSWDAGRFVAGSGETRIVWADDFASSVLPERVGDWFAPFGAELQIDCLIGAWPFSERISLGSFVISGVPNLQDQKVLWEGRAISPGQAFTVSLQDPLVRVQRGKFAFPVAPGSASAWSEIQRVTGMPVVRNLPDAFVPRTTSYEGAKADVVNRLFDLLDAWPHVDASGVLTGRPKAWPAAVDEVRGVVSEVRSMEPDRTFNRVVVEGKSPDGDAIFAIAEITEGPLRVRNEDGSASPFGEHTLPIADEMLDTYAKCLAVARSTLSRVAKLRTQVRDIVEPFNPLREVGDVLKKGTGVVRVAQVTHEGPHTRLIVEVPDE